MKSYDDVLYLLITKGYMDLSNVKFLVTFQLVNKKSYLLLYSKSRALWKQHIHLKNISTLNEMNTLARLINEFKYNNNILHNKMYDFIIHCYTNWSWISMDEQYKSKLIIPSSKYFKMFLSSKHLKINDMLPKYSTKYTHFHHQSQSFSGYKSIEFK